MWGTEEQGWGDLDGKSLLLLKVEGAKEFWDSDQLPAKKFPTLPKITSHNHRSILPSALHSKFLGY
jgi:hypothetical protein